MINMDAFVEAFFAIDQDRSETITIDELQAYMVKNDMDPSFIARWQELFDPQRTGIITLAKFCDVLGLELEALRFKYVEQEEAKIISTFDSSLGNVHGIQENNQTNNQMNNTNNKDNGLPNELIESDDYLEISGDMPTELKETIFTIITEGEHIYGNNDKELVKWIKLRLDKHYKRLWHCVIVRGQYSSYYSYQPGYSFCFRHGPRVFLLFKTPNM
uniref:Calcium-binding EF-hand,domain-containing protein n=1 Tax=Schistosoma japonicum TaxID=6182 RepID=Q86EV1_SCHJA|nr:SJCHGC06339 protein [Schistosoma japonicum]CAX69567.1 Calcium-binding EF-hand,domain-containing protein [Schistosoma japonicum]